MSVSLEFLPKLGFLSARLLGFCSHLRTENVNFNFCLFLSFRETRGA